MKKIFFLCLIVSQVIANPQNFNVINGDVLVESIDPNTLLVEASDNSIIEWDRFDIQKGESTHFELDNPEGAVLNKVTGDIPSDISGLLSSNGFVYLVNPAGIIVSEKGVIDTQGFLASTLDISYEDFLNQNFYFESDEKSQVVNLGTIQTNSGNAILIGYQVKNQGLITTEGNCLIGAGKKISLIPDQDQMIQIQIDEEDLNDLVKVEQKGIIESKSTYIAATATPYSFAIQNSGIIEACGLIEKDGKIVLVAEKGSVAHEGTLSAQKGRDGGHIHLEGEGVYVAAESKIDVSGKRNGGSVYLGNNLHVSQEKKALKTLVEENATILAESTQRGNGGHVLMYGKDMAGFYGLILAKGGSLKGDGGLVEINAERYLDAKGLIYTNASNGLTGTLKVQVEEVLVKGTG
ncbi:MAG TPA: filamentous hemagglutinin N-terminal domain-containing protein, partial [Chlamydiales bacterium]|nr:filamentous hemagglutinin N-terminal domain-containing protein [Chlamydiales bacterium]